MKFRFTWLLMAWGVLHASAGRGQDSTQTVVFPRDRSVPVANQRDMLDVMKGWFPTWRFRNHDPDALHRGQKLTWVIPQIGYSPQTGFLAQIQANMAFRNENANVSTGVANLAYTENQQLIFSALSNTWLADNAWNLTGDWRVMHYPQSTHGLGMNTSLDNVIYMTFNYLRLYQSALRRVAPSLYAGLGYALDYHWNIEAHNDRHELTRISRYPYGVTGSSVSSGPTFSLLYDNRANSINPVRGFYTNLMLRTNLRALGSDQTYQSVLLDVRKYVHLPGQSDNILAFWSYNVLTFGGNPPFLDLPSTGWDSYGNTGRGFVQGRYRGKNLLYLETEYRFAITRDRLLGGVAFVNAQSVSQPMTNEFTKIAPAAGLGLRLKMNKYSRTNLAVDYGFGGDGSRGLYFNLGEVF
jgi:outer membrane protein assembly factor BamA